MQPLDLVRSIRCIIARRVGRLFLAHSLRDQYPEHEMLILLTNLVK